MGLTPTERQGRIQALLRAGKVSVQDLAAELGVSEITVRRDLAALRQQGKLLRVYGGALPKERVAYEFSFKAKETLHREAKASIGRAAAALVEPGSAVFLDTGTTTLMIGRELRAVRPGVIVTINLCVASEYVGQTDVRVLLPGGQVSALSPDVYGEWTVEALSNVTVDTAFLGCDSVDPADGFYSVDPQSAAVSRLMLSRSRAAYLVADSSKFGRRSMCRIAPLDRLKGVVTDRALSPDHSRALKRLGLQIITEPSERKAQ